MRIEINGATAEDFAKRALFLAYYAISGPTGMGILQARSAVTEDDVWENVSNAGDYPMNMNVFRGGEIYGDYVFGRMMKWGCQILDENHIETRCGDFRPDYQGFSHQYPDNKALFDAVAESLKCEYKEVATEKIKEVMK